MRQVILAQFALLDRIHPSSDTADNLAVTDLHDYNEMNFDNLDMEETRIDADISSGKLPADSQAFPPPTSSDDDIVHVDPPEKRNLPLPSKFQRSDDVLCRAEVELRVLQAGKILAVLRDLIAEKSFLFSHVIRIAPRKGVRTRARSEIAKLNVKIGYYCRVYSYCRIALVHLKANNDILSRYRIIERKDIASSGALLNPNEPGSSTHRLSWIWQTGHRAEDSNSPGLYECTASKYLFYTYNDLSKFFYFIVNRVHWLRARAQQQRWREEYILVHHEMEWTVRYYIHQSKIWKKRRSVAEDMGDNGAAVYASRKAAMWDNMASSADSQFRINCDAYKFNINSL